MQMLTNLQIKDKRKRAIIVLMINTIIVIGQGQNTTNKTSAVAITIERPKVNNPKAIAMPSQPQHVAFL